MLFEPRDLLAAEMKPIMKYEPTTMDNTVNIVEISQTLQYSERHVANNVNVNGAYLLIYPVQRAFVHEFHADADVGVGEKRAIE
jgi:hypothetical protein